MSDKGLVVLFTGLPSAGKSTLAEALTRRIEVELNLPVSLLDGDENRKILSYGLGFSKEDRSMNILRNAYVAAQVGRHGGIAVCALIAPYAEDRRAFRARVTSENADFIEIYVATGIDTCINRDVKGLYAKAKSGQITGMTGIDDPYETPEHADLVIRTEDRTIEDCVAQVFALLADRQVLATPVKRHTQVR
jgi:adenylyl-sulfate kinase